MELPMTIRAEQDAFVRFFKDPVPTSSGERRHGQLKILPRAMMKLQCREIAIVATATALATQQADQGNLSLVAALQPASVAGE